MIDLYKEPMLTFALDMSGKMVSINSVKRGLSCNCRCPKCGKSLVAKHGNGGRHAHFAHRKDSDCHGSYMTALHKLAEQIIEEEKAVMAPAYKEIDKQKLSFEQVEIEQRIERKDLQPDIAGITSDGFRWFIEIRNTHEVDDIKRAKLKESNITCMEIDVREQTLENLKSFLLESVENKEWIYNPNYEFYIVDAKRKRVSQVERLLLDSKELIIPVYHDTDTQKIDLQEVKVLSKSDDGLYERVKVFSSGKEPFIINIGSRDSHERVKASLGHEVKCNELTIFTDNLNDANNSLNVHDIKWLYNLETEKILEENLRDYKENSHYDVRDRYYCNSQCKYKPYQGNCIYKIKTIPLFGVDYVVCNKDKIQKDESGTSSTNHTETRPQKLKSEDPIPQFFHNNPLPKNLQYNISIEREYKQLLSTRIYKTEEGIITKIVKIDKIFSRILLLYKDRDDRKKYCPYHIVNISATGEDLHHVKVSDFRNLNTAMRSYSERLEIMCANP